MVGWWLFASSMKEYISSLSTFHNENMSSINVGNGKHMIFSVSNLLVITRPKDLSHTH